MDETKIEVVKKVKKTEEKKVLVLRNTQGVEVDIKDYFYNGIVPPGFEGYCGRAVDREDLLAVFNKIFNPRIDVLAG